MSSVLRPNDHPDRVVSVDLSPTLLAVHAHPDDETITMGGTLARYHAEGVRTVVVTCTNGELGTIFDPGLVDEPPAPLRLRELEAAASVLGISRLVDLGYLDSGMPGTPENDRPGAFWASDTHEAARRLSDIIQQERPQVMVTYDETGGYGHPDHIKCHLVSVAAFRLCCPEARPAKLYFVRFPLTWSREFVSTLREAGIDAPGSAPTGADAGRDVAEVGTPDELVTTRIDISAHLDTKLAALACYASQMPRNHFLRRMPRPLAARLWRYEFYSREFPKPAPAEAETELFD